MKLCPNCHMMVTQLEVCPYCKTELSKKDEQAFRKDYFADLIKCIWLAVLSLLVASVSLIVWGETLSGVSIHTLSFAALSLLFALLQFRSFGKYSRRFHTSTFWRVTTVVLKYTCAVVALLLAVVPVILLFV